METRTEAMPASSATATPLRSLVIAIAGSGGDGVALIGDLLLKMAAHQGLYGMLVQSYGPQIRGGESAVVLRIGDREICYEGEDTDVLVCFRASDLKRFKEMRLMMKQLNKMGLGAKLGAQRETFMGLAGLGDLVLTCTDDQSRNRRFGMAVGRGATVEQAQSGIGQVVEGVLAARAVLRVAAERQVEMPICQQVHAIIHEGRGIDAAVQSLMSREIRAEGD